MLEKRMGLNSASAWMSIASSRSPRILRNSIRLVALLANPGLPAASKPCLYTGSFSLLFGDYERESLPIFAADGVRYRLFLDLRLWRRLEDQITQTEQCDSRSAAQSGRGATVKETSSGKIGRAHV